MNTWSRANHARVFQRLLDVLWFQVGIFFQDRADWLAMSDQVDDERDRYAHAANTCLARHNAPIESDPIKTPHRILL